MVVGVAGKRRRRAHSRGPGTLQAPPTPHSSASSRICGPMRINRGLWRYCVDKDALSRLLCGASTGGSGCPRLEYCTARRGLLALGPQQLTQLLFLEQNNLTGHEIYYRRVTVEWLETNRPNAEPRTT